MPLKPCRECAKEISEAADICPHCGVKNPGAKKQRLGSAGMAAAAILFLIGLVVIGSASQKRAELATTGTPSVDTVDSSTVVDPNQPVESCDFAEMGRVGHDHLAPDDAIKICQIVSTGLGGTPTIAMLRQMFKTVFVFQWKGDKQEPTEIAYQLMNLAEARGGTSLEQMHGTFDTAFKLYETTSGHVTPKDLNVFLRSSGPMAHTLSDDGLAEMGLLLWEEKKERGE
jgi:hypothetical protein